jgi:hypothetical protein
MLDIPACDIREGHTMKRLLAAACAALCLVATAAQADRHTCDQLRLSVVDRVPAMSRELPYDALDCAGISELHLLLVRFHGPTFTLNQRIEAIFRRYGLVN